MKPFGYLRQVMGGVIAGARGLQQLISGLQAFEFTADDPLIIDQKASGAHISINPNYAATSGDGASHPFKVTGSGGQLRVAAGSVMVDADGGGDIIFTPICNGIALDSTLAAAGALNDGSFATGYVMLVVEYNSAGPGGAINVPWRVVFMSDGSWENTYLQRANGANGDGTPAVIYLPICRIVNGAPVNGGNIVRANLMIRFQLNQLRVSGVGEPLG